MKPKPWWDPIARALAEKAAEIILNAPLSSTGPETAKKVSDMIVDADFEDIPPKSLPGPAEGRRSRSTKKTPSDPKTPEEL